MALSVDRREKPRRILPEVSEVESRRHGACAVEVYGGVSSMDTSPLLWPSNSLRRAGVESIQYTWNIIIT